MQQKIPDAMICLLVYMYLKKIAKHMNMIELFQIRFEWLYWNETDLNAPVADGVGISSTGMTREKCWNFIINSSIKMVERIL